MGVEVGVGVGVGWGVGGMTLGVGGGGTHKGAIAPRRPGDSEHCDGCQGTAAPAGTLPGKLAAAINSQTAPNSPWAFCSESLGH